MQWNTLTLEQAQQFETDFESLAETRRSALACITANRDKIRELVKDEETTSALMCNIIAYLDMLQALKKILGEVKFRLEVCQLEAQGNQ